MTPCWLLAACLDVSTGVVDVRPRAEPLPSRVDGVYGRFDSDLDASFGAGASYWAGRPGLELRAALHYVSTAGIFIGSRAPLGAANDEQRVLSFGVDLRPAFLPRFSENMQQGPATLDLTLDSISLSLGPYFAFASDPDDGRGLELSLGAGLPFFGTARGPWLQARGLARFPDEPDDATFGVVALLSWHEGFASPLTASD
jgi:hypothetical protein